MSKASKLRPCPALGRGITSADCGEQRQSRLACPADCPHNPFGPASYAHFMEMEGRVDKRLMERLAWESPHLQKEVERVDHQGGHAMHAYFAWKFFFATGADGTTFGERWERAGLAGFKNDERFLLRAKMRMRIALIEVHRVTVDGRVEAVDLLSPGSAPMILQDLSLASVAVRFSTLLVWVYPLPHYWRLSGTACSIPDMGQFLPGEIVREIVRHLGGPPGEAEMRRWLAEHFVRFATALEVTARSRRQAMFAGLDAKWGKVVYELRAPFAQCRQQLDDLPDVVPGELSAGEEDEGFAEARDWFDPQPAAKAVNTPGARVVLGRVLLGQTLWRLETFGTEKLARLRRQFEEKLGDRVRFSGERVDDFGARLATEEPAGDQALVPPRLLEDPEQFQFSTSRVPVPPSGGSPEDVVQATMRASEQAFLDNSVPALDGRTPREAARDPVLRPKLVQLLKQRVRAQDERNLQTGRADDINWLLTELDLREILLEAPPWRPPPFPRQGGEDGWSEPPGSAGMGGAPEDRPPAPALPPEPLEVPEASARLQKTVDLFATAAAAQAELLASGSTLLDDADELTLDSLSEHDFSLAVPYLLQVWFALVPPGCRAPEIDFASLEMAFQANLRQFELCMSAPTSKKLTAFLQSGRQPGLMLLLLTAFLQTSATGPKNLRPSLPAQPVILALLKSVVDVLDEALRQTGT